MNKIYDITIPIKENMPCYPGDYQFFSLKELMNVEKGDMFTIKQIQFLTHTGTHIDAPSHFIPKGKNLDELDISKFIGIANVFFIDCETTINVEHLEKLDIQKDTIVLFKTKNSEIWKTNVSFKEDYIYLSANAAKYLVERQIKTVGIDYLSIDGYNKSLDASSHIILLSNNIPIIEAIDLSEVPEGRYNLHCLPLKIIGADGSPARAILETL